MCLLHECIYTRIGEYSVLGLATLGGKVKGA
jgi:hypothetical protein